VQIWRSVFERLAPLSMPRIEMLLAPQTMRQGNNVRNLSDEALEAIADAYREVNGVAVGGASQE